MDNNVVDSIFEAMLKVSIIPLKFNFRGVGASEGEFSNGPGEQADVAAAIDFVGQVKKVEVARMGLVGYSAGAAFSFSVGVRDARVKAVEAISPPVRMFDFNAIKDSTKPKFLVTGSQDEFVPLGRFREPCRGMSARDKCLVINGADHFWQGFETGLADKVVAFFKSFLVPEST